MGGIHLLLFVASLSAFGSQKKIDYDITQLVLQRNGNLPLIGGKNIDIETTWAPGTQIVFEDLLPEANWEHPAKIKVLAKDGSVLQEMDTSRPPVELKSAPRLTPLEGGIEKPEIKLNDYGGKYRVKTPQNYYAFLFNGYATQRHWNDFSFLYKVLVQVYGYSKDHIYVADSENLKEQPDLDGDGLPDIKYGSNLAELTRVMNDLKATLKPEDHLFVAINDHGARTGGQSTIMLHDRIESGDLKELPASDFGKMISQLPVSHVLSIFAQCFAGGFVRPTVGVGRVSMAASTDTETSWAKVDPNRLEPLWDEWIYHVTTAFAMQTHDGKPVKIPLNAQGQVSAQTAAAYAELADARPESPFLESTKNSGDAAKIGLGF